MTVKNVKEFHEAFGHPVGVGPSLPLLTLRFKLIDEEFHEVAEEMASLAEMISDPDVEFEDRREVYRDLTKELADLKYVIDGLAVALALPLEEVEERVHASNMSKLGEDGKPIYREDGKVLKGPNYKPVNLDDLFGL